MGRRFGDLRTTILSEVRLYTGQFFFLCASQAAAVSTRNSLCNANRALGHGLLPGIKSIQRQICRADHYPGIGKRALSNRLFHQRILFVRALAQPGIVFSCCFDDTLELQPWLSPPGNAAKQQHTQNGLLSEKGADEQRRISVEGM